MPAQDEYVVDILRDVGLVTNDQIQKAKELTKLGGLGLVDALIRLGFVTQMDVTKALASQFGMDTINLGEYRVPDEVIALVPRHIARRYKIVPVYKHDSTLTVAISDPLDVDTVDSLRYILKMNVEPVVASKADIEASLTRYYGSGDDTVENMLQEITEGEVDLGSTGKVTETKLDDLTETESDAPIIKLVGLLIMEAYRNRASDIHIEPLEKRLRVRYRIDGVLHEVDNPPKRLQAAIISRIKIMANMSIAEKRVPQDGRIQIPVMGRTLDLRVSCAADQSRRKHRDAYFGQDQPVARAGRPGIFLGPAGDHEPDHRLAGRRVPGHRPDGVGQDDDVVRLPEFHQQTRPKNHYRRGPGGVSVDGSQPGAGQRRHQSDVCGRVALDPAPGAEHHHDR